MTQRMNENFLKRIEIEKELLCSEDVFDLINDIEPVNPIFYYQRLICEKFPNSEFAEMIGTDYEQTSNQLCRKRNPLIFEAIDTNIRSNSIEISPSIYFADIKSTLTRNDKGHGIAATGLTKEKCFLCAFVFNLNYEELKDLLIHCTGDADINYKNPYEVLIAYCTTEHTNVCEHFLSLKKEYEKSLVKNTYNHDFKSDTLSYQKNFESIDTDETLIDFLVTLPNEERLSSFNVFKSVYEEIVNDIKDDESESIIEKEKKKEEENDTYLNLELYYENKHIQEKIERMKAKENEFFSSNVVNRIFGEEVEKREGKFAYLKRETIFDSDELKKMLEQEKTIRKSHLVLLLFYKYYFSGDWIDYYWDYENDTSDILCDLYYSFCAFCNGYLQKAGFSDLYLPDALTRVLVFCLFSDDPMKTFHVLLKI